MTSTATRAADLGHPAGSAEYRRVVGALFAAGLATFTLLYSTQAILPALSADFGLTATASSLSVSLTTIALGLTLLVAAPLSDRYGRTRLVHASLSAAAVVGLACALAPTWPLLLVLRTLLGVVLAGLPAVATAYLREELHPSTHARAAGLYIGGTALGGMTGRLLTGGVADVAGWRWALAASGLVAIACAVAVRVLLPPSRGFVPTRGHGRLTAALRDPALLGLYAVGFCASGALVAVFNTIGFRLEAAPFGLGLGAASLVFLCYPLGSVSSVLAGRIADRLGRRAVLPVGSAIAVVGVLVTLSGSLAAVTVGLALLTVGFFAVHGVASGWVPARAHAGAVGAAQAASLYLFSFYLGSSVLGSLGGTAWTHVGWPGVVALSAGLLVVSAGLALGLRRTTPLVAAPAAPSVPA